MSKKPDYTFEIGFYESILRREPTYDEVIEILGGLYTKAGRIDDGLRMDRKLVRLQPDNSTAHYNLACSFALLGRANDALRSLEKAVELGYDDVDWMIKDPDLKPLAEEPRYAKIIAQLKNKK